MDFTLNLATRWFLTVGVSTLLWVIPIVIQAPPLIILFCLISSIVGFVYSAMIAGIWKTDERRESKRRVQAEEIENYALALEEQATKHELEGQFSWVPEVQAGSTCEPERPEHRTDTKEVLNLNGDCEPGRTLQAYYTNLNLTAEQLAELLPKLKQTMTKAEIIDQLWGIKKGGSAAYKRASQEFDQLISLV